MKKYFLGLSLIISTQMLMATIQTTGETTLTGIISYPSSVIVTTASSNSNVDGCTSGDPLARQQLILPLTSVDSKNVYATLLSAYVAGEKIIFIFDGCVAGIPAITRTDLVK